MKGIGPWSAFRAGFARVIQQWPLWILFYLVLAVLGGLLLSPLLRLVVRELGHRLAAVSASRGAPGWLLAEMARPVLERPERVLAGLRVAVRTLPAWPFVLALPFILLSAGALPLYAAGRRRDWSLFRHGVRHWAGPFTFLLLLEVLLLELSVLLVLALTWLALRTTYGRALWVLVLAAPVLAALAVLIPWWFEYARALAVVQRKRHARRLLGEACSFLLRNLGPAAGLALFNFLLPILPGLLYLLLVLLLPGSWWMGRVIVQQLLVFALVGTRLVRLASEVCLVQGRGQQPQPENPLAEERTTA